MSLKFLCVTIFNFLILVSTDQSRYRSECMQQTYQSAKCCNIDLKSPPGMVQCQKQYSGDPQMAWMVEKPYLIILRIKDEIFSSVFRIVNF